MADRLATDPTTDAGRVTKHLAGHRIEWHDVSKPGRPSLGGDLRGAGMSSHVRPRPTQPFRRQALILSWRYRSSMLGVCIRLDGHLDNQVAMHSATSPPAPGQW